MKKSAILLLATILCTSMSVNSASAEVVKVVGTMTVSLSDIGEFNMGDEYSFSFSLDDSIADSASNTAWSVFSGAASNFALAKSSGSGTWDPAGTFTGAEGYTNNSATDGEGDFVVTAFAGSGFPSGSGGFDSYDLIDTQLYWSGGNVNETSIGQTLTQHLGGPFDTSNFTTGRGFLNFDSGPEPGMVELNITSVTVSAVPEPTSFAFLCIAGAALAFGRRRWRNQS